MKNVNEIDGLSTAELTKCGTITEAVVLWEIIKHCSSSKTERSLVHIPIDYLEVRAHTVSRTVLRAIDTLVHGNIIGVYKQQTPDGFVRLFTITDKSIAQKYGIQ